MNKAVFFDKDGVLNVDKNLVNESQIPEIFKVDLIESAADTIAYCRKKGFKIFIITNQTVIARGLINEEELATINKEFERLLLCQNSEAKIDKIYYCPHHPSANIEKYRVICDCRKPKPGLLLKASEEFAINLEESYMIGDRISDIYAGKLAGCKTILLRSGMHDKKLIETDLKLDKDLCSDYIIDSLSEIKGIV